MNLSENSNLPLIPKSRMASESEAKKSSSSVLDVVKSIIALFVLYGAIVLFAFLGEGEVDPFLGNANISILQSTGFIAYTIQIIMFVPAFILQTEKFYDLTGSLTYTTCILYSFFAGRKANGEKASVKAVIVTVMVLLWCSRLGYFLFRRVMKAGKDGRFDDIKPNFWSFIVVWALQGLWVFLTAFCALIINSEQIDDAGDVVVSDFIGLGVWVFGFAFEALADYQKTAWRESENKPQKFINVGLWSISRHPNYFGEMLLWWGVFILSISSLQGKQFAAVVSPIFVYVLINFLSGVPLLEKGSDERFGDIPEYWEYKRNVNSVLPLPYGWGGAKNAGPKEENKE